MRKGSGQLNNVARAAGINPHRQLFRHRQIVNCREMKHARRLLLDQIEIRSTQRQAWLADVALDKLKLRHVSAAELRDPGDLLMRASEQRRLHEQDEVAVLPCESLEEPVRDEARETCYEKCLSIRH